MLIYLIMYGLIINDDFKLSNILIQKNKQYDFLKIDGSKYITKTGYPMLPFFERHFALEKNSKVIKINIKSIETDTMDGFFMIEPTPPPSIIGYTSLNATKNDSIYNSSEIFPEKTVVLSSTGEMRDIQIITVNIYPIKYIPKEGKIILIKRIIYEIEYENNSFTSIKGSQTFYNALKNQIQNKNFLNRISLAPDYDHIIITTNALKNAFERLKEWQWSLGIKDTIILCEDIYSTYTDNDNQEKIRHFISDAVNNWGVKFVLLGGDVSQVPVRTAYSYQSGAGYFNDEDSLKCDLYYADIDGNWDSNNDGLYGTKNDNVDMYPDIMIGRAPVNGPTQVENFIDKVIAYETHPDTSNTYDVLMLGAHLDASSDAGVLKDQVETKLPAQFKPTKKLYDRDNSANKSAFITEFNKGYNLFNHADHSNTSVMGTGNGEDITKSDADNFTNKNRQTTIFSIGCWAASFDYDCIAEHFVNNQNGGAIAFVGNSRYGLYYQGHPEMLSGEFDVAFFEKLFTSDSSYLGLVLNQARETMISKAKSDDGYRWCMYVLNLLGEPSIQVWREKPIKPDVTFPSSIHLGNDTVEITVKRNSNVLSNADVILYKKEEIFERKKTGTDGRATFAINTVSTGYLQLRVKGTNISVFADSINIVGEDSLNANFTATPTSGNVPLTVSFTDNSTGNIISWDWNFGDGQTSSKSSPTHTFSSAGTYSVRLIVSDSSKSDTLLKNNYITVTDSTTDSLNADFIVLTDSTGCAPLTVSFEDSSKGSPTAWSWSFGDGETSNEKNPSHIYTKPGSFSVQLIVSKNSTSDTVLKNNLINVGDSLIIDFSAEQRSGYAPLLRGFRTTFKPIISFGNVASYLWEFADATSTTDSMPVHYFSKPGNYWIRLTATSSTGCKCKVFKDNYITVKDKPDSVLLRLNSKTNVIELISPEETKYTLSIYDIKGGLIKTLNISLDIGTNEIPINEKFSKGVYFIVLNHKESIKTFKFVIVK